jgi:polyisoprenoid-binding protein YceI
MKKLLYAGLVLGLASGQGVAETYQIDPSHSQVLFTYNHLGFSNITGRFGDLQGQIVYDPADAAKASVKITVPIATVSSGVADMDAHFKRDDLFDATKFPTATFESTSVTANGERTLRVVGDLTIHGITRETGFDVTINKLGEHPMRKVPAAGFDAVGTIKRSDFGVDKYVPNIPDEVTIRVTTEAVVKTEG